MNTIKNILLIIVIVFLALGAWPIAIIALVIALALYLLRSKKNKGGTTAKENQELKAEIENLKKKLEEVDK